MTATLLARLNGFALGGLGLLFGWLGVTEFADGVRNAGWSGHIEQVYSVLEFGLGTFWILLAAALHGHSACGMGGRALRVMAARCSHLAQDDRP